MTRSFVVQFILFGFPVLLGGIQCDAQDAEFSNSGLIRGFRYTDCRKDQCLIVEAPKAWISNASGGFVAEAAESRPENQPENQPEMKTEVVSVEVLRGGKSVLRKSSLEAVLRPEIDLLTFENEREVVLIQLSTLATEVVKK